MYKRPAAPLPIRGVIEDAIRLYRNAFNRAWVPALILQMLVVILTLVSHIVMPKLPWDKPLLLVLDQLPPILLVLYTLTMIVSLVFSNAITAQLLATREGRDLSIGGSIRVGVRYFVAALLLGLLLSGIFAGGALISGNLPQMAQGLLALIYFVFAVYLAVRVVLAPIALLGDGATIGESIRASWRVTRGNWWHAGFVLVLVLLIYFAALLVLSVFAALITAVIKSDTLAGMMAVQLVAAVIQGATLPFLCAGLVSAYYDLKLRSQVRVP